MKDRSGGTAASANGAEPQYIDPPQTLLSRIGRVSFSDADVAAADRSIGTSVAGMSSLVTEGIAALRMLWDSHGRRDFSESVMAVRAMAHDLAGYGATLGFPLVTTLARSLCRFIDLGELREAGAYDVIAAHVDALHVVVREKISGDGGALGQALIDELNRAVTKFRARPQPK